MPRTVTYFCRPRRAVSPKLPNSSFGETRLRGLHPRRHVIPRTRGGQKSLLKSVNQCATFVRARALAVWQFDELHLDSLSVNGATHTHSRKSVVSPWSFGTAVVKTPGTSPPIASLVPAITGLITGFKWQ